MRLINKPGESSQHLEQFGRFLVVGLSNFAVSFTLFYLFYIHWKLSDLFFGVFGAAGRTLENIVIRTGADSLDATLANVVGYSGGIINSFTWNKLWTFQARHQTAVQFLRFLTLNIFCLFLSSFSLFLFTDYLNWPYLPVWLATMTLVTLINFAFSKFWVFGI